jgi:hypothetical protein
MPYLFLFLAVLALVVLSVAWDRRDKKRVEEAAEWPTTEATIQQTEFKEFTSNSKSDQAHLYPCFAFSYVVDGEYYSGRFGLAVEGEIADELARNMKDQKFEVSYQPERPSEYYIPDELMGGYEVLQNLSARGNGGVG